MGSGDERGEEAAITQRMIRWLTGISESTAERCGAFRKALGRHRGQRTLYEDAL